MHVKKKLKSKINIQILLAHCKLYINRRPVLRRVLLALLSRLPALKRRILLMQVNNFTIKLENLSPRAYSIYADLKKATKTHKKEKRNCVY